MEKEDFKFQYTFNDKEDYESYNEKYSNLYSQKTNDIREGGYKLYTSIVLKKQIKLQKAVV